MSASTTDTHAAQAALALEAAQLWPAAAVPGALHIVSTPIGHLADITLRALAVLRQVAAIYCEDTRQSRVLLSRYGIATPTVALHEHNEARTTPFVLDRLRRGDAVALISDAGTPLVSDPGARLVAAAASAGLPIVPVPGASAVLAALVASGLVTQAHTFLSFLPRSGAERAAALQLAASLPHVTVLFESPNRLVDTLRDLAGGRGAARTAAVARELTKHFEELKRGTLDELIAYYESTPPKGEVVIVLAGVIDAPPSDDQLREAALAWRAEGRRPREIVALLMDEHGASRNVAYRLAHDGVS